MSNGSQRLLYVDNCIRPTQLRWGHGVDKDLKLLRLSWDSHDETQSICKQGWVFHFGFNLVNN